MSRGKPVIRFQNVGKQFVFNRTSSTSLSELLFSAVRRQQSHREMLWGVRDVSFDVHRGQSVGLIGHNGSGKSTLLKLATRILRPTMGTVTMSGRVSALLELGAGFHDDLTGRENIFLNGSVMGLSRREIETRFDEMVDFSELHDFIDVPVKHYSSGMYMRLGFSVAVHCQPDILLVDEILAVGDRAFQRKCLDRIYQMKRDGVTIMLVSHHLETLQKLCDHVVWMDHGNMLAAGDADTVLGRYIEQSNSTIDKQRGHVDGFFERNGTYEAEITAVRFFDAAGVESSVFTVGHPMTIELMYVAHQPITQPEMGFAIFRDDDLQINGTNNRHAGYVIDQLDGEGILRCHIDRLPLLPGRYDMSVAIQDSHLPQAYDFHVRAYSFRVIAGQSLDTQGVVSLSTRWECHPD